MNKYTVVRLDMHTEPYPKILTEREMAIFFNVVFHTAKYVMEKGGESKRRRPEIFTREFRKQIAESEKITRSNG